VLVVDDEESLRHMLGLALSKDGYQVWTAGSGREALDVLAREGRFDVCVTDVRMPGMDGLAFVEEATRLPAAPTMIAMSAYGDEALALEALRRGAFDYVSKPFEPVDLSLKLRLLVERRRLRGGAPEATPASPPAAHVERVPPGLDEIVSVAPSMRRVLDTVGKVASFPTTVLLTGETGTGKERIAGAIHREGKRKNRPFVAVNCGAIPESLLESELFGHVKGAFTDANQDKVGLFEVAHGGTLFLDEIAELPPGLQVKLLRVLVEHEIRRVGSTEVLPVDVRVIAATSRDLASLVRSEAFREDLYYRLAVVAIHLPPLRERREDVPVLVEHFARRIAQRLDLPDPTITQEAMRVLEAYDWPGNVRELENAIERALVLSDGGGRLTVADLDDRFDGERSPEEGVLRWVESLGDALSVKDVLPRVERSLIRAALDRTDGHRTRAADLLCISPRALHNKLREYGIK
jgi:two-component system response regulator AtoC